MVEGQHEAHRLAVACFVKNIGFAQFRKMAAREREALADLGAGLDFEGCARALRFWGVSRGAPDLISHANDLEAENAEQLVATASAKQ